jgi:hypothetical protein
VLAAPEYDAAGFDPSVGYDPNLGGNLPLPLDVWDDTKAGRLYVTEWRGDCLVVLSSIVSW